MYRKIYRNMRILCLFTIILTTLLIVSACYTVFENRIKDEIRSETRNFAEVLNNNADGIKILKEISDDSENHRVTVIHKNGEILYDSYGKADKNHSDREEVSEALDSGAGESQRFSNTLKTRVFYYAVRLNDGNILRISRVTQNNLILLIQLILPIIFVLLLVYILCVIVAVRLTENITKPFEEINLTGSKIDCEYDELKPFLNRIQRQQQEIVHQIEHVKMQKSRLQAISENMSEGLVVLDKNENILSINQSALQVFTAEQESVIHKNFMYLCRNINIRDCIKKTLDGNKRSLEFTANDRYYQIFLSPVFESDEVSGVVMLLFDISARYEIEQIRREFSANVSHELKTPITTILGYSQIINTGIAKQEDILGFTKKIEKETTRLIKLIEDIIKISKLDNEENNEIKMQKIHLLTVVDDVFERLSHEANKRNVTMQCEGNDIIITANLVQITELVYNLCENAIKYNRYGGKVTVILSPNMISFSDTGIGISKEYLSRIFERFFRVDKSRSKSVNGTGLGLSIVKHIAKCHNAKIDIKSEIDKGTIITVTFRK